MNYIQVYQLFTTLVLFETLGIACAGEENIYSFLVKVKTKGKPFVCAGTILTPCIVLTSAHCVVDALLSDIAVTTTSNVTHDIIAVIVNPQYDSITLRSDLALVQTKKNFKKPWVGVYINSVENKILTRCNRFQMVTWADHIIGNESTTDPIKKTVHLISNEKCASAIESLRGTFQGDGKICGVIDEHDEEDSGCFVSPGGPLICYNSLQYLRGKAKPKALRKVNYLEKNETLTDHVDLLVSLNKKKRNAGHDVRIFLVGVLNWGKGCSEVPSVYERTDYYYNWIVQNAKHLSAKCGVNMEDLGLLTELKGGAESLLFLDVSIFIVFLCVYYIYLLVS